MLQKNCGRTVIKMVHHLKSVMHSVLLAKLLQLFHLCFVDGRTARSRQGFDNLLELISRVCYDAVVVGSHVGDFELLVVLATSAHVASEYPQRRQIPKFSTAK